jgi:hypothetical protein
VTKPAQARQSRDDAPRTYAWPPLPPHEFEVISVTSALKSFPKPFLIPWAVKVTAERAIDKYKFLGTMIEESGPKDALKWLKDARWADTSAKADRGTIVHAAIEAYMGGKEMTDASIIEALEEARVPSSIAKATKAMVNGVMEFLDAEEPEVYWSESTVYSRTHGYAGTADLIGRMRIGGSLQPVVIDVKTSKAIYDEVGLQLAAYAKAEFVGLDDGTEAKLTHDGEPIRHGVVVRPKSDGTYEKAVFTLSDELLDVFLACKSLAVSADVVRSSRRPS